MGEKFNLPNICIVASGWSIDVLLSLGIEFCSVVGSCCGEHLLNRLAGGTMVLPSEVAHIATTQSPGSADSAKSTASDPPCCCLGGEGLLRWLLSLYSV